MRTTRCRGSYAPPRFPRLHRPPLVRRSDFDDWKATSQDRDEGAIDGRKRFRGTLKGTEGDEVRMAWSTISSATRSSACRSATSPRHVSFDGRARSRGAAARQEGIRGSGGGSRGCRLARSGGWGVWPRQGSVRTGLELLQIADAVAREKSIDRKIVIAAMETRSRSGEIPLRRENDIRCEIDARTAIPSSRACCRWSKRSRTIRRRSC